MSYIKKKIGDVSNIPYVTLECDTLQDLQNINVENMIMGSRCYVVNEGATYALNSGGEWREVPVGGGASSWNDLEDKPFYEETVTNVIPGLNITWDGNTSGLPSATMGRTILYRVSELTPTLEQLQTATVVFKDTTGGEDVVRQLSDATIAAHNEQGLLLKSTDYIAVQYIEVDSTPPGLYFPVGMGGMIYCSSITAPEFSETISEVKTIESKYLPEALQFGEEVAFVEKTAEMKECGDGAVSVNDIEIAQAILEDPSCAKFIYNNIEWELVLDEELSDDEWSEYKLRYNGTELSASFSIYIPNGDLKATTLGTTSGVSIKALVKQSIVKTIDPKYLPQTDNDIEVVYLDGTHTNGAVILSNLRYVDMYGGTYIRFDRADMTRAQAEELYDKWIRGKVRIFSCQDSLENGGSENFFLVTALYKMATNSSGTYYEFWGSHNQFGVSMTYKLA